MVSAPQEIVDAIKNGDVDQIDRDPVPAGDYLCRVKAAPEYQGTEYDGVNVRFEIVQPREFKGKSVFDRLSWSPKAAFKIRDFWDAFGYDCDSDFDELVDDPEAMAVLEVSLKPQKQGKRAGELQNNVEAYIEATPEAIAMVGE